MQIEWLTWRAVRKFVEVFTLLSYASRTHFKILVSYNNMFIFYSFHCQIIVNSHTMVWRQRLLIVKAWAWFLSSSNVTTNSSYSPVALYLWYTAVWFLVPGSPLKTWFSLHFNSHFPGEPGLAGARISPFWILLELRVIELMVTTGAIIPGKFLSKCHH